jgi:ATP synthase F1 epsilon subunit
MIKVEIRTIDELVFEGEAVSISFNSTEAYVSIYEGHEDLILQIRPGQIEVQTSKNTYSFFVLDGVAKILDGQKVVLLVNELENTDHLDPALIRQAIARAEENIKNAEENEDYTDYDIELLKAQLVKELAKENSLD